MNLEPLLNMSSQAWICLGVITLVLLTVIMTRVAIEWVFLAGLGALYLLGIVGHETVLRGFSSEGVFTLGVLSVVTGGMVESGAMMLFRPLFRSVRTEFGALTALLLPVVLLSAVLKNAAVVSVFSPMVTAVAKRGNFQPSKLLLPLSYISTLAGLLTVIGTGTTLVISGMYFIQYQRHIGFFDIFMIGLPVLTVGIIYLLAVARWIPNRCSAQEIFENTSDFTAELLVPSDCAFVGQTLAEARLKNPQGGHLFELHRFDNLLISPVDDDDFVMGGDRLVYSGHIEKLLKLRETHGLVVAAKHVFITEEIQKERNLMICVVPETSSLIGRAIASTRFETEFDVVLIAVSRFGERITESPRQIPLQPGDTLLIDVPNNFLNRADFMTDLVVLDKENQGETPQRSSIALFVLAGMVLMMAMGWLTVLQGALLGALGMLITGCCSVRSARRGIEWNSLIMIACAVSFGLAIHDTGLADAVTSVISGSVHHNPWVMMGILYLLAATGASLIPGLSVAALLFPIAVSMAWLMNFHPAPFMVMLIVGTGLPLMTPAGYDSNLIVFGPGGYRTLDFVKIGIPLILLAGAAALGAVALFLPFAPQI